MLHDNRIADIIDATCSKNGRCKVEIVQMEIRKSFYGGINEMHINKLWISVVNLLFISLLFVFVQ